MQSILQPLTGKVSQAKGAILDAKHETESEAHQILRSYAGHALNGHQEETIPGIRHPGATGVIYCTDRAQANGFSYADPEWANLGQGAPEVGGSTPVDELRAGWGSAGRAASTDDH